MLQTKSWHKVELLAFVFFQWAKEKWWLQAWYQFNLIYNSVLNKQRERYAILQQNNLRKVRTFASAHTFCASRKAYFKGHARAGVDIDAIKYATKYTTNMKAKYSYCDEIKCNEHVLKLGVPE